MIQHNSLLIRSKPDVITAWDNQRGSLYDVARAVLGHDTRNYKQEIGDSIAFAGKNALEYLQLVQILLGEQEKPFHEVYVPYLYYVARVLGGNMMMGGSDGATLDWLITGLGKTGVLAADGMPPYTGAIARDWGKNLIPRDMDITPKPPLATLVQSVATLRSVEDMALAVRHGYPALLASQRGYEMFADERGFHNPKGTWNHVFTAVAVEGHPRYGAYFVFLNSWGDAHGHLNELTRPGALPTGTLRVRWDAVDDVYRNGRAVDSCAFSPYDDFPARADRIDAALHAARDTA